MGCMWREAKQGVIGLCCVVAKKVAIVPGMGCSCIAERAFILTCMMIAIKLNDDVQVVTSVRTMKMADAVMYYRGKS